MDGKTASALAVGAVIGAAGAWALSRHVLATPAPPAPDLEAWDDLDRQGEPSTSAHAGEDMASLLEEDEVVAEHLTRNVQFFGLAAQQRIASAFVVVIGLGGVGSHAAHLLLRSGVGRLRLVDFDQVSLSSLNRHCCATRADVGIPKTRCLEKYFGKIMPEAQVEVVNAMCTEDTLEELLAGSPDFVFDAIDNIDTKVALLAACSRRGIPVLASAGAGAKTDPTRLRIVDVAESVADPLARAVRHRLRRDHGISTGVPILLSTEKPQAGLIYGGEEGSNPLDYQVVPGFRVRTIPVLGTMPALFGMAAASWILCTLAGRSFVPEPVFTVELKQVATQLHRLESREHDRFGTMQGVHIDLREADSLVREYWRARSARARHGSNDKGLGRSLGGLALTRWRADLPATPDNLVLLTREEADAHDAAVSVTDGVAASTDVTAALEMLRREDPDTFARIQTVLARVARDF